jgi:hypothetical protein
VLRHEKEKDSNADDCLDALWCQHLDELLQRFHHELRGLVECVHRAHATGGNAALRGNATGEQIGVSDNHARPNLPANRRA